MNLTDKIQYEYHCFFLDMMRTSKENIFEHSGEIETKKGLSVKLLLLLKDVDEMTTECLLLQENLLESAYHFIMTEKSFGTDGDSLQKWLDALLGAEEKQLYDINIKRGLRGIP